MDRIKKGLLLLSALIGNICLAAPDEMVISPSPHSFGTVYLNQAQTQSFQLLNTNTNKNITEITLTAPLLVEPFNYLGGSYPGTGGTCSSTLTLTPGQSCTVVLRFLPTSAVASSGTFKVSYRLQNAPKNEQVALSGTGEHSPAALTIVDGNSYDFLQRPVGHTARKIITLKNTGQLTAANLTVSTSPTAPFSFYGGTFPGNGGTCTTGGSLPGGSTCTVELAFSPSSAVASTGSVAFTCSCAASPTSLSLAGTGETVQVTGVPDTAYGTNANGIATASSGSSVEVLNSLTHTGDDSLVGGGFAYINESFDFVISKYKVNGSLDTSFNGAGMLTIDFSKQQDILKSVLYDSSGNSTLVGSSGSDFAFVRVTSDGSLDTSFNVTGTKTIDLNGGSSDFCHAAALQTDGKTLAVGTSYINGFYRLAAVRLDTNGVLDTMYNATGTLFSQIGSRNTMAYAVALQTDGKAVVAGTSRGPTNYDMLVIRYLADGTMDPTFNTTGYRLIDFVQTNDRATDLVIQTNGAIVIAGRIHRTDDETVGPVVVRLLSDGSLDTSFGTGGKFRIPTSAGKDAIATVRELASGGTVFAWFRSQEETPYYTQVTKLLTNGTLDNSFGTGGTLTTSIRGVIGQKPGLTVQGDGKVLIGGTVISNGNGDLALERHW